ncbi:MAG: 3-oxoadipate enol-lactonase [Devosia sp.]|nr:3-oxoadipate enol-lactonase [Devosia sp.]
MGVESFTAGDGCRIAYRLDGPPEASILLLSNSLGTDMDMWLPQLASWKQHFRVLRYDQRGHGGSDAPPGAYSIDRLTRDAVELLDALAIEVVDFCGLSLGGMVGQAIAIREAHRVRRLVLANTTSFMGPPAGWAARIAQVASGGMASLADASIERWFTPDFARRSPGAVAQIRDMLLDTSPIGYAGCCAAIRDMDMRPTAPLIAAETLIIAGREDTATPPSHATFLVERIRNARLAELDAAHLSNVECPDPFGDLVIAFLRAP